MRVDKIGMATSIEARVPFLDHRIVEFAFRLPRHIKLGPNDVPKYILKKASEGILPNEHIYRKKMGFAAPVNEWLKTDLKQFLEDHPTCQAHLADCGAFSSQVHHKAGRTGKLYLDITKWLAVCHNCHVWIEQHPLEAKEMGFSLNRL